MHMYGWTTWGKCHMNGAPDQPEFQVFKHWTGPLVAVDESIPRDDAFLMLAQMNEHLEALYETTQRMKLQDELAYPQESSVADPVGTMPEADTPCGSDHCAECK